MRTRTVRILAGRPDAGIRNGSRSCGGRRRPAADGVRTPGLSGGQRPTEPASGGHRRPPPASVTDPSPAAHARRSWCPHPLVRRATPRPSTSPPSAPRWRAPGPRSSASWPRSPPSPAAAPTRSPTSTSTPSSGAPSTKFQQELVVFGRIDDDQPWRVGLYGIDLGGEQLVVDWRAPVRRRLLPGPLRRAAGPRPPGHLRRLHRRPVRRGLRHRRGGRHRRRCSASCPAAVAPRCAPRWPRSSPSRTSWCGSTPRPSSCCGAGPAPARPWSACTGPPGSSTTTPASPPTASSCIGPSDRFLRFVAAVLPTLGEARIVQTTFDRPARPVDRRRAATSAGSTLLDRFEDGLLRPAEIKVGLTPHPASTRSPRRSSGSGPRPAVAGPAQGVRRHRSPTATGCKPGDVSKAARRACGRPSTAAQALRELRSRRARSSSSASTPT